MTASIPVPATASVGQLFTAAAVNAQRDTDTFLLGSGSNPYPACSAWNSGNISNADSTFTLVTMDSESWDTDATMHSTSSNTSRVVFPVTGLYSVKYYASFASNSTGSRRLNPRLNSAGSSVGGTSLITWIVPTANSGAVNVCLPIERRFTATDHTELFTWQNSGGALNVVGVASTPWAVGITARFLSA